MGKKQFTFSLTLLALSVCFYANTCAQPLNQKQKFNRQDTLRGSITPERSWWDASHYAIEVTPDYEKKSITGVNEIKFKVLKSGNKMQLDLQQPMEIKLVSWNNSSIPFTRDGNVYYINFPSMLTAGKTEAIRVSFEGTPKEAKRPPWDGGWIWAKDEKGRPWMSVACQGLGASVWYPCKDHQSDEPEGAILSMTVADTLVAVGNGRLLNKKMNNNATATFTWAVVNPINSYNIIPYIGKYVTWHEDFMGEKGKLDCDYWVLDYDLEKATKQFTQATQMLRCFENWFGPYPFYEDGFKLVEAPHLGMEHQSAVAYGNRFQNGYRGRDLSGSGWGLKWDFIIIHESGHEWFANNITSKDIADMWIHESFTNYSETIFTECQFGKEAGTDYVAGTRKLIENDMPIIGVYGVNQEGSGDMYYKGGNMLHTIRTVINNDELFREILRGLNKDFYHQTVTTKQVEDYMSKKSKIDLSKIFDQYLRTKQVPELEYYFGWDDHARRHLFYRWKNCVDGFNMPVQIQFGNKTVVLKPTDKQVRSFLIVGEDREAFKAIDTVSGIVNRNYYITWKVNKELGSPNPRKH